LHPQSDVRVLVWTCRYFATHIDNIGSKSELSVYCDVDVFAWLLQFIQAPCATDQPVLTCENAMAILISSNFLRMAILTPICTVYIADKLLDMTLHGADIASLAQPMLMSIAKVCLLIEAMLYFCIQRQDPLKLVVRVQF
jgi:hypothetical protein